MEVVKRLHRDSKKDYINYNILHKPKSGVYFTEFMKDMINRRSRRFSESYSSNYITILHHIDDFCRSNDVVLYTNSINEEFLNDFVVYLEEKRLKQSYISLLIILIKGVCRKAGQYGYLVDPSYDDVSVKGEDSFAVYLTMSEITRLYYFKGLTKKQEKIRDLFIVGCLTGLRYSDYSTLTTDNFQGDYIVKLTKKTKKKVIIPIHDYVREIYNKYQEKIFLGLCLQHFNEYIKEICRRVGINDIITWSYQRGGRVVQQTKKKWELITSHTARRSMATNMYLSGRMKLLEIMAITGHTTESSFMEYIKVTNDDISRRVAGDVFFKK